MLKRCPICKYSLTGLPDRHACPECGFSYDKQMIVETPNVKTHLAGVAVFTVLYSGLCGWMVFRGGVASIPWSSYLILASYPLYVWYLWRRRHSSKIIVWRGGMQLIRKSHPSSVYSWDEMDSIEKSAVDGLVTVGLRDGRTVRAFGKSFFGSHRKTGEFVDRLKQWQDTFRSLTTEASSPPDGG